MNVRAPALIILLLIAVARFAPTFATDFYVTPAPTGNDGNAGTQLSPFATISHAASVASAGGGDRIVLMSPGAGGTGAVTFTENAVIAKPVDIGPLFGALITVIPANPDNFANPGSLPAGHSSIFLIQSSNVTIHDITIDGTNPGVAGTVGPDGVRYVARNGIIADATLGMVFTNLTVKMVVLRNVYLRGIQNGTSGSMDVENCTISHVNGDVNSSLAIFNRTGSAVIKSNTVSFAADAIAANFSTGTQFLNNIITNSGSGIHTDNTMAADIISGNIVANSTSGGFGVWAFVPTGNPQFTSNTITNVSIGLAAVGGSGGVATFSSNVVDGANQSGSIGAYATTNVQQFGFGDFNCSAVFTQNTIKNNTTGMKLEQNPGFTLTVSVDHNIIASNSSDGIDLFGLTSPLTIGSNDLSGNYVAGINNIAGIAVNAAGNWWGSASGPRNPTNTFNVQSQGPEAGSNVTFAPWLNSGGNSAFIGFSPTGATMAPVTTTSPASSFSSIQAAINASAPGATVTAITGTYTESLVIPQILTLNGSGASSTTISAAGGVGTGPGGENAIVSIRSSSVAISGFTIDGLGAGPFPSGYFGILVRDGGSASIHDNVVQNIGMLGGAQNGVGICIGRKALATIGTATIANNTVRGYEKAGILIDNAGSSATITGNTVTGAGSTNAIAQNGIQISRGATGVISSNSIVGNFYSGSVGTLDPTSDPLSDGAAGILLYAAGVNPGDTVSVSGNTLLSDQFAIWSVGTTRIDVHDNYLQGDSTKGAIGTLPFDTGLAVWNSDQYTSLLGFTPVGTTGTLQNNTVVNFDHGLLVRNYLGAAPAPNVVALKNSFSGFGNTSGVFSSAPLDARQNWWGSPTGPQHSTNPPGIGFVATESNAGFIQFSPWLGDGTDTQAIVGFQPNAIPLFGRPQVLAFSIQPASAVSGAVLATQPVVAVTDTAGFVNPFFTGAISLALSGSPPGVTFTGLQSVQLANGAATFKNLSIDTSGTYTLAASSGTLTPTTSSAFMIAIPGPAIVSAAMAQPNPAAVGMAVTFTVSGSDATGRPLTVTWDFGDGSTLTGSSVVHTYTVPSIFLAQVTLTNPEGASVIGSVIVRVTAPATAPTFQPITVQRKFLHVKFPSKGTDVIQITGTFALPAGTTDLTGVVNFSVGTISQALTLTSKGSGKNGPQSFRIRAKFKKKILQSLNVTFQSKLVGNGAAALLAAGLAQGTSGSATLPVQLIYANTTYATNISFAVKATLHGATGK